MNLSEFCTRLTRHPDYRDAFVFRRYVPPREAEYGTMPEVSPETLAALRHAGIDRLYRHQAEALEHLRRGANVLVSTPTASGKTLIYNMAVAEEFVAHPEARALYVFPLKALEQDQLKNLRSWLSGVEGRTVSAEIYDGDTTPYMRKKIRTSVPDILFTNPDMLHRGILPHHDSWEALLKNLSLIVLDEVHTYRGIFGSHLNQVIRRLKRLCRMYGSAPRFILLSATVSNPEQFGASLIEEKVEVVRATGAPRAGQHFLFLNPGASPNFSAATLFDRCLRHGFRTIAFTQSRKVAELIHVWVSQLSPGIRKKVSSYRAGFMPEERRQIERGLASGDLLGVVSTSALEMGIDIGFLDICLLVGYPGTIITTWQRGGRVGRAGRESLVLLVAKPDALDQYFMNHPDELFERSFEAAVLDPFNPYVVDAHLPCAAAESPLTMDDRAYWGDDLGARLDTLKREGVLLRTAEGAPSWFPAARRPHLLVNMRSTGDTFTIFERETGQAVGTVSGGKVFKECHQGAVYLHRGESYTVDRLILDKKDIVVHRTDHRYFTRTRAEKETEIIRTRRSRPAGQFLVREGDLKVTEQVTGFEKRALPGQELMGVFDLDLPSQTFETVGFWMEIEPVIKGFIERRGLNFMGGIHAVEHASIGIFPLFALCDRNDIGGICYPFHPQVGKSAIFIYDGHPGGVGLAQRGFEMVEALLEKTLELVKGCGCEDGCPSCIHSPKCGSGNKPLDKQASVLVLEALLGRITLEELSEGEEDEEEPPGLEPGPVEEEPARPRILYLDLETRKLAQEVGGWKNTHLMRVSVVVVFDSVDDAFHVYFEDRMDELMDHLGRADLIVGFNIKRFDYRVLGAYTNMNLSELPTFDILEDVHARLGFRLGLDHLASETLDHGKTADGLKAVEWFRQGEMDKLTDYCREDVAVTRDLFLYGLEHGHLIYRSKKPEARLRILVDWDLEKLVARKGLPGGREG